MWPAAPTDPFFCLGKPVVSVACHCFRVRSRPARRWSGLNKSATLTRHDAELSVS